MFLLTDGAVGSPDSVIELVRRHCNNTRVHTFGLGSGASRYLVKECAIAGRGTYQFAAEGENLNPKVISSLKRATCPALTQSTISWANHGAVILQSPENAEAENVYQDEPFNVFAILKKADVAKGEFLVNLQGHETLNQQMLSFDIKINAGNAVKGEELFQLAARKCI